MAIRERVLTMRPLCVHCEQRGVTSVATQVDHIIEIIDGGTDDMANLQGLCDLCHEAKTNAERRRRGGGGFDL